MKICTHARLVFHGNEETGLRAIECGRCGEPMTRQRIGRGAHAVYIYLTMRLSDALKGWH